MTLKEEFETLRGEPIRVFEGDAMNIPCNETSDSEKLCRNPVVSVHMITYNHEPYIRQAIEGVMMQKTDFEFELVIGEDASTDKTREICFEYQKRFPERIRILWSHENLYSNPHPAGENGRRVTVHCRGEYIAFCEGDDYWIDPYKLQKQVDIMRQHPDVGLCFCDANVLNEADGTCVRYNYRNEYREGVLRGRELIGKMAFGADPRKGDRGEGFVQTASTMIRRDVFLKAIQRYEILNWSLCMADVKTWLSLASLSNCFYLSQQVSVYRKTLTGACGTNGRRVIRDGALARIYFSVHALGLKVGELPSRFLATFLYNVYLCDLARGDGLAQRHIVKLISSSQLRAVGTTLLSFPVGMGMFFNMSSEWVLRWLSRWVRKCPASRVSRRCRLLLLGTDYA